MALESSYDNTTQFRELKIFFFSTKKDTRNIMKRQHSTSEQSAPSGSLFVFVDVFRFSLKSNLEKAVITDSIKTLALST